MWRSRRRGRRPRWSPAWTACGRAGGSCSSACCPRARVGLPLTRLTPKELELVGTFRFHEEFGWAVDLLVSGRLEVAPLLTGTFGAAERDAAFAAARDRERHMKVQLVFEG